MGSVLMALMGISSLVCDVLKERPFVPTAQWITQNVILPPGSEIKGPYRLDLFPHCVEVFECFDDPDIERITLQWASRLGKTSSAIGCMVKESATKPSPQVFGDADEKSVKRVLARVWQTMEGVAALRDKLPPKHLRGDGQVRLVDSVIHGAWSGSPATAADFAARIVVKNEASKMSKKKSEEAPFAELIDERAKGFRNRKILEMSTPTVVKKCYIEAQRLLGDNRRRLVPCPFCNCFQELIEGVAMYSRSGEFLGLKDGGLRWEKSRTGHSSPEIAKATAWYECRACKKKIREEHRYKMLNAGIWVPEGCDVDRHGKITGTPARPGNHASFGPLSSLHSLLPGVTLGVVAEKSVQSRQKDANAVGDPQAKRRNFINSWMGLTWDPAPQASAPNELAARLCIPGQYLRKCADWVRFLTRGSDVQAPDGRFEFWWEVWGWGVGGRGCLVDYGVTDSAGMRNEINTRFYDHADGGCKLRPMLSLIDSGNHANEMYAFCREFRGVLPCKGSSTSTFPTMYRLSGLETSSTPNKELQQRLGGLVLFEINHNLTNWWVDNSITGLTVPDQTNGVSFPEELQMDDEFFRQWASEYPSNMVNDDGYEIHEWRKRHRNEWRDAARYAMAAAWYQTNGGKNFNRLPPRLTEAEKVQQRLNQMALQERRQESAFKTPDGRPYFVGNR